MIYFYLIYLPVVVALNIYTRRFVWTEEQAALPPGKKPGFGPRISLSTAARDFFYHFSPWALLFAISACAAIRVYVGLWSPWDAMVVLGFLSFWPLQELFIHKYLEHLPAFSFLGRKRELFIVKTHRAHHKNPWDPKYGLTTINFIILFVCAVPFLWFLGLPLPLALTGMTINFLLILYYEWIHYLIHTSYVPRTKFYKRLWRNHRLHHFQNEHYWYGLTMLSGDMILGTQPPPQETSRSDTCITLGVEDGLGEC